MNKVIVVTVICIIAVILIVLIGLNVNNEPNETPSWIPPGRGPWNNDLMLAISEDGLHFTKTGKILVERAGVPNLLTDSSNGRIVAIFQYFSFEKEEEFNKMAISFSYDEGETWTNPQVIKLEGSEEVCRRACDPTLVLLDDGNYRLYFTGHIPDAGPATHSAISYDCINFNLEEGVRFSIEGEMILDPSVIKIGDKWHYYTPIPGKPGIPPENKNYHAVSDDGLSFTRVDDVVLDMTMLGNAIAVEGGYRFYASRSAFSTDGDDWTQEDVRMPGPDPGVVRLKDGTYLFVCITPHQ